MNITQCLEQHDVFHVDKEEHAQAYLLDIDGLFYLSIYFGKDACSSHSDREALLPLEDYLEFEVAFIDDGFKPLHVSSLIREHGTGQEQSLLDLFDLNDRGMEILPFVSIESAMKIKDALIRILS